MTTLNDIEQARINMIEQQIRPWKVLNQRVLDVFHNVKRENFVSDEHQNIAFSEIRIPLSNDSKMLFPALEGRILQEVKVTPTDNVLLIGTGSGFLAACLAKLGAHVVSLDINADHNLRAKNILEKENISNVEITTADIQTHPILGESFDVIIMTGSCLQVPEKLLTALTENGRLLAFVGVKNHVISSATLYTKVVGEIQKTSIFEVELERLIGFEDKETFEF